MNVGSILQEVLPFYLWSTGPAAECICDPCTFQ